MRTSESIAAISKALLAAQRQIKDASKTATNPHFKNKYAPIEEVIGVCKAALNANGIVFIQGAEISDPGTLALSTRLLHESGEWIESTLTMTPAQNNPQGIGACITYSRRYGLAAICGLASDDDDDGNVASDVGKPAKEKPQPLAWYALPHGLELIAEFKELIGGAALSEELKEKSVAALLSCKQIQQATDMLADAKRKLETNGYGRAATE